MIEKELQYHDGDTELKGFLCYDESASTPLPAVLVCPDWTGRNPFAEEKARRLAKQGIVGFAVDVYGNGKQGSTKEEKAALIQPFLDDRALLRRRLTAALQAVTSLEVVDSNKVAVIGFCFGGLCALDLARSGANLKGAVSFHGLLFPPENLPNATINAKVLVLHGYDDPMVPPEQVMAFANEMTTGKVDWQIHMYGNTLHAFTNPEANDTDFGTVYSEVADKRANASYCSFLREIFEI